MTETLYSHAGLGFGFNIPQGWNLELESANANFPVIVSLRAGSARVMVASRQATSVEPSQRAAMMKDELSARKIEAKGIAATLNFPSTGNVAAVEFQTEGKRQQWVSMVTDGVEFSFTHTDSYEDVRKGLERVAATFRMPPAAQSREFLRARVPKSPFVPADDLKHLSHYQRVAARFNVPAAKRPTDRS